MAKATKNIIIDGQFASGVLGSFRIIRGFATLQDLAAISAPFPMGELAVEQQLTGHQRSIDAQHAESIKRYLQEGRPRFIPEIILSIRVECDEVLGNDQRVIGTLSDNRTQGLWIGRKYKSQNVATHEIIIMRSEIDRIVNTERRIRRIDGNHRLHLASQLEIDPGSPTKYLAPFCAILLGPPGDANDDFVESMLFHTINSTALPLDSEHALQLVLGQAAAYRPTADEEFVTNVPLHLTRLLKTRMDRMPQAQRDRLGATPATVLFSAATAMVADNPALAQNRDALGGFAENLCGALTDILARLPEDVPELCKADFFIELASLVWGDTDPTAIHNQRVNETVKTLIGMGRWLGRDGLHGIQSKRSLAQQLDEIYRSMRSRVPKRVFLARWYPTDADGQEKTRADLRLAELRRVLDELHLELIDMGTQLGGTYQIPPTMYDAINSSDIVLADLTGVRPNVMIEVGFALRGHDKGRMLLYYETTGGTRVPFDIAGFQYVAINQAAEIDTKLKPFLQAIIEQAEAAMI